MPLLNEILQGRQQNLLTKLFSMVGGSPAPQLSPEIQPGVDLLTSWDHDTAILQGYRHAMASALIPNVAAQYPHVCLRNGAGIVPVPLSLLVIYRAWVASTTTQMVYGELLPAPAQAVIVGGKGHSDTRATPFDPNQHNLTGETNATAATTPNTICGFRVSSVGLIVPLNIVLAPSPLAGARTAFQFTGSTVNTDLAVTFWYYYREMTPGELVP